MSVTYTDKCGCYLGNGFYCQGEIKMSSKSGRSYSIKGTKLPIPNTIETPSCVSCGEIWLSLEEAEKLQTAMETHYQLIINIL